MGRIIKEINRVKDKLDRAYKCINKDTVITTDVLINHIKTVVTQYNQIVDIVSQ